ncbi:MAG: (2Fe-2S) ferredoxin domain-containing protein [Spirochaetales bacterium]|jgi:NADP-reducing hydrogenase subunit HndB|nr:(2Fe-2S) ferredoxin domain-containing protein [Spirochaetales bacterium]
MAKMTLEDLRKLRETKKSDLERRSLEGKDIEIIIGMGTCGIAAGAKVSLEAFLSAIDAAGLKNVTVKQTGCMGLCYVEPTAEIRVPGMPDTIYGKVDADTAREIVETHLVKKKLVENHIFDRPAADVIRN